ncbi:MAG: hypothetical protein AAGC43_17485 [Bacteroidota bacterium]
MRTTLFLLFIAFANTIAFGQESKIDLKTEYDKIEQAREFFIQTLKEKQYQNLAACITRDYKTVNPGTAPWQAIAKVAEERGGIPYDSVAMYPMETVIVSDSIAYDFGKRKTYYTDNQGKSIELQDTFLAILKKGKDGNWRLHREVASGLLDKN